MDKRILLAPHINLQGMEICKETPPQQQPVKLFLLKNKKRIKTNHHESQGIAKEDDFRK